MCKGVGTFPTRGISANLHAFAKWYCQQLIVIAGLTLVVSEANSVLLEVGNFSIYSFSHPVASFKTFTSYLRNKQIWQRKRSKARTQDLCIEDTPTIFRRIHVSEEEHIVKSYGKIFFK